jgi:hypothetical protein
VLSADTNPFRLHPHVRRIAMDVLGQVPTAVIKEGYRNRGRSRLLKQEWLTSAYNYGCAVTLVADSQQVVDKICAENNLRQIGVTSYQIPLSVEELQMAAMLEAPFASSLDIDWLEWWWEEVSQSAVSVAIMQRLLRKLGYYRGGIDGETNWRLDEASTRFCAELSGAASKENLHSLILGAIKVTFY